jgi:hypothetical protein
MKINDIVSHWKILTVFDSILSTKSISKYPHKTSLTDLNSRPDLAGDSFINIRIYRVMDGAFSASAKMKNGLHHCKPFIYW